MPTIKYPTQTLQDIALVHARCRTLSPITRDYFQWLADGGHPEDDPQVPRYTVELAEECFWEAATSCVTRAGQSRERRAMVDALGRLRRAVQADGKIPVDRSYVVGLPVIVTVHTDGRVTYEVDVSEMAQAIAEDDQTDADIAQQIMDAKIVEDYLDEHAKRV